MTPLRFLPHCPSANCHTERAMVGDFPLHIFSLLPPLPEHEHFFVDDLVVMPPMRDPLGAAMLPVHSHMHSIACLDDDGCSLCRSDGSRNRCQCDSGCQ